MSIYSFFNNYIKTLSKTSNYKNSIKSLPKISTFLSNLSYCGWSYTHIYHSVEYTQSEILQLSSIDLSKNTDKDKEQSCKNKINNIMRNKFLKFPSSINSSNILKTSKITRNTTILDFILIDMSEMLKDDGHAQQLKLMCELLLSPNTPSNAYYLFFNALFSIFGYVRRLPKIKKNIRLKDNSSMDKNHMNQQLTKLKKDSRKVKSLTYIQRINCLVKANRVNTLLNLFDTSRFSKANYDDMKFCRDTVEHGVYNPSKFNYTKLIQLVLVLRNYIYATYTKIRAQNKSQKY